MAVENWKVEAERRLTVIIIFDDSSGHRPRVCNGLSECARGKKAREGRWRLQKMGTGKLQDLGTRVARFQFEGQTCLQKPC